MGNGICICNSDTGDVPASKCEYKVDISDNSLLINNNNNNNLNNQSKIIDNNNINNSNNNEFLDKIFPGGDNINNFFENKEKGLNSGNNQNENNIKNTSKDSKNDKIEEKIDEKDAIEEEDDQENKKSSSKSQDIEKGNEEIIKVFDKFIKEHAKFIEETQFIDSINPKIKEIENNLEVIEEQFDSEIHDLKLFKKGPLLFKKDNILYSGSWNSKFNL